MSPTTSLNTIDQLPSSIDNFLALEWEALQVGIARLEKSYRENPCRRALADPVSGYTSVYSEHRSSMSRLIEEFYECLEGKDDEAAAAAAQGEASKLDSPTPSIQFFPFFDDLRGAPQQVNANGFGGGHVIQHLVITEDAASRERRIMEDSTFELLPAPFWTRKSKKSVVPCVDIKVGADCGNPDGDAKYTWTAPQPTAKVSSWLEGISETSSVFENLFEVDDPMDLCPREPYLSDLDSFSPTFEMKDLEGQMSFEVPDLRARALTAIRDLAEALEKLTKYI